MLCSTGIDIPAIHNSVYNSFTEGRARLFGYVINRKMKIFHNGQVAHMSLTEQEMRRFWFQQGDSEGFVNYPLTIRKMKMSAIFIEHHDFIRVSLRSRGKINVNLFASRYFNGGGHKNAPAASRSHPWPRRCGTSRSRSPSSPPKDFYSSRKRKRCLEPTSDFWASQSRSASMPYPISSMRCCTPYSIRSTMRS